MTRTTPTAEPKRMMVTVDELADMLHIGRTQAWELVRSHQIRSVKVGRNRRIPVAEVAKYIDRLLAAEGDSEVA